MLNISFEDISALQLPISPAQTFQSSQNFSQAQIQYAHNCELWQFSFLYMALLYYPSTQNLEKWFFFLNSQPLWGRGSHSYSWDVGTMCSTSWRQQYVLLVTQHEVSGQGFWTLELGAQKGVLMFLYVEMSVAQSLGGANRITPPPRGFGRPKCPGPLPCCCSLCLGKGTGERDKDGSWICVTPCQASSLSPLQPQRRGPASLYLLLRPQIPHRWAHSSPLLEPLYSQTHSPCLPGAQKRGVDS